MFFIPLVPKQFESNYIFYLLENEIFFLFAYP